MKRVIIESPYAGATSEIVERNLRYLRAAIRDCFRHEEAPFASHRMYTDALDDHDPMQRRLGIAAGMTWGRVADLIVFYVDLGMSPGMIEAKRTWDYLAMPIVVRTIPDWERR